MLERTKWDNGNHTLEFESPDILHVHVLAPVQPHEALETMRILDQEVVPHVGETFMLIHLAEGAGHSRRRRGRPPPASSQAGRPR